MKVISIIMALLLVLSILPVAFAEETTFSISNEETTETTQVESVSTTTSENIPKKNIPNEEVTEPPIIIEDEKQIKDLEIPIGAQLRFLQLQRSIMKNIFVGEQVITVLQKNYADKDFTSLININNKLKTVLENVQSIDLEGKDNKEIAQEFVTFKKSAIDLTKQFKNEAKKYTSYDDTKQIKEAIKENKDEIKNIDEQIKSVRRELNAKRIESILMKMGIENPELIQKIKDGTVTKKEVMDVMKNGLKSMIKDKKIELIKEMKSNQVKRVAMKEELKNKVKNYKNKLTEGDNNE